jgi:arsenite methyltransferase
MSSTEQEATQERVRARYAAAASRVTKGASNTGVLAVQDDCCAPATADGCCSAGSCAPENIEVDESFGSGLYSADEQAELPAEALAASLGCGNPLAVAELHPGETVLDLGSGGGIDVLLSARRVGPSGFAYGVDMTDEMLALARANAAKAGTSNVEFVKGTIENVPLPDGSVDAIISNCVINLSVDKPAVITEMFRLLKPGGRIGISDVVAEDHLTPTQRAERGSYVGCIAGALSRREYLDGLAAAGFADAEVVFTHQAAADMHAAIIRATKPVAARATAIAGVAAPTAASNCCSSAEHATCCDTSVKADCCGQTSTASSEHPPSCGCR